MTVGERGGNSDKSRLPAYNLGEVCTGKIAEAKQKNQAPFAAESMVACGLCLCNSESLSCSEEWLS